MTIIGISRHLNVHLANDSLPSGEEVPRLSPSIAHTLVTKSPLHAFREHRLLGGVKRVSSSDMDLGSAIHAMVLGKGSEVVQILGFDDWRKKEAQELRKKAREDGNIPLLHRDYERAVAVSDIVTGKLSDRGVLLTGESERRFEWRESLSGVECSGVLDHLIIDSGRAFILDLKTGESANPRDIRKKMFQLGSDIQWAAYTSAVDHELGTQGRVSMLFSYVETNEPYCVTLAEPDGLMKTLGQRRWERAQSVWSECLRSNTWPEYSSEVVQVSPPTWALKEEEEYGE